MEPARSFEGDGERERCGCADLGRAPCVARDSWISTNACANSLFALELDRVGERESRDGERTGGGDGVGRFGEGGFFPLSSPARGMSVEGYVLGVVTQTCSEKGAGARGCVEDPRVA